MIRPFWGNWWQRLAQRADRPAKQLRCDLRSDGKTTEHKTGECRAGLSCILDDQGKTLCVGSEFRPCLQSSFADQCVQKWAAQICRNGWVTYQGCDLCTCDEDGSHCACVFED